MTEELVKPTVINAPAIAACLATLILQGDPEHIPGAAEVGRAVLADETLTEQHRRSLCRALAQPDVCTDYCQMVLLCADDYPTRMDIIRQTAVFVYTRSA